MGKCSESKEEDEPCLDHQEECNGNTLAKEGTHVQAHMVSQS